MTDKAIVEIPLDTSAFDAFRLKFEQLRKQAGETPKAWDAVGKTTDAAAQTFEKLASSLGKMHAALDGIGEEIEEAGAAQDVASDRWAHIASSAKQFGANVKTSSLSLAKWTGLTSLFAGIMSAGGLYGISRMAAGVSGRRTASLSYGMGYGEFQSYQTNFARFGNAGGLLSGFNTALNSVQDRWPLYALMGPDADRRLAGKSAGAALAEALPDIKRFVDNTDPRNMAGALSASGLDRMGVDLETALTFRRMSPQEIAQVGSAFSADQGPMGLSREMAQKWQEFDIALATAGSEIENRFAVNLVHLAPGLTRLADGLANLVDHALQKGGPIEGWLKRADRGLEEFAGYVGSKSFLSAVGVFVKRVDDVGSVIGQIVGLRGKNGNPDANIWGQTPGGGGGPDDWRMSPDDRRKGNRYFNRIFGLNSRTPEENASSGGGASNAGGGATPRPGLETPDQSTWGANDGSAYAYLKAHARGGATRPREIDALHPVQAAKMAEMIRWTKENLGYNIGILSAARRAGQTGSGFDSAGMSLHPEGLAGDFDLSGLPASAYEKWAQHARAIGLYRPWSSRKERNHWQIVPDKYAKHSFNAVDMTRAERLRRQGEFYPIHAEPKHSARQRMMHHHGRADTVHVDDETGDADVKKTSRTVGPMSYGTDFGRFGH